MTEQENEELWNEHQQLLEDIDNLQQRAIQTETDISMIEQDGKDIKDAIVDALAEYESFKEEQEAQLKDLRENWRELEVVLANIHEQIEAKRELANDLWSRM